eukprot:m.27945 g.27945  ORF g.27945 m.27945 type:complete len:225 (+) comp11792_c0_seq1:168-842(+)
MPETSCATATGFYVRAVAYLIAGVAAAVAAATLMIAKKQLKKIVQQNSDDDYTSDYNYCPFILTKKQDLIQEKGGHCDYIEFASIASAVFGLIMFCVTVSLIIKGKLSASKWVYVETVAAGICLLVLGTAAILATLGFKNTCHRITSDVDITCKDALELIDGKKLYTTMLVCRDSTWAMAAGWLLLVGVLCWRSCNKKSSGRQDHHQFSNPNAMDNGDMFSSVA